MKKEELLERLFYVDLEFNKYTYLNGENISEDKMIDEIREIKNKAKNLPIEKIREKIIKNDEKNEEWRNRFKEQKCIFSEVNVSELITDEYHNRICHIPVKRGMKFMSIFEEEDGEKLLESTEFVSKHIGFFIKEIPIVVRRIVVKENMWELEEDVLKYEVLSGTHRVIAFIQSGRHDIPALIMKREGFFRWKDGTKFWESLEFKQK